MKRIFLFFVILIFLLVTFVFFAKDWLVKEALESAVRRLTGFETKIEKLALDLPKRVVYLENVSIYNPALFQERVFADIQEIYLAVDAAPLIKKEKIHFHEIRLHIRELHIEKNSEGISNVSLLKSVTKRKKAKEQAGELLPKKQRIPFYLDRLELTLSKVSYNDRSGIIPKKAAINVQIEKQVFQDIRDPKAIVNLVLMKVLYSTTFGNLGLDPPRLQKELKKTVHVGVDLLKQTREEVTGVTKKAEVVVKGTVDEATGILSQATGAAKEEISGLLGKLKSKVTAQQDSADTSSQATTSSQ